MLPIFICYDTGLDMFEIKSIAEALKDIMRLFPERHVENFGSAAWSAGDYSSADWYVSHTRHVLRQGAIMQLDARSMLGLLYSEPWQKTNPHIDLLFTSRDLTANGLNFCFGMASGRVSVQSVFRYRGLCDTDRRLAIKAVVHHELGHILGCAKYGRIHTKMSLGSHCTNHGCIMRQGLCLSDWVQHARDAERAGWIYCPECLAEARQSNI